MSSTIRTFSALRRALCLALVAAFTLSALAADYIKSISIVDVKNNSRPEYLDSVLQGAIGTRPGQELSLPQLSKDMASLAKLAGVSGVSYKTERYRDGSIALTYLLTIQARISAIRFEGNKSYKESKLMSSVKTKVGDLPDEAKIAVDRKTLINKYEEAGYHGTEVYTSLNTDPETNGSLLTFIVKEEPRYKLKGVAFTGNTVVESSELSSCVKTQRQWWRYIFRFGNYYNGELREYDIDEIVKCYGRHGYLDCQVTEVVLEVEDTAADPQWVTPTYQISEGIQYHLGKRAITGNVKFTSEELLARCAMKEGDIYSTADAQVDLDAMKALYQELGYLDLQFIPVLAKNPASGFVDVTYTVHEGTPSTIRNIVISGNVDTTDRVIRRELAIYEDDLADQRRIDQTKARLDNLGYFSSVEIVPKATDNPAQRDLSIQLEEKPTGMISIGAGYSTEDSVMGFGEVSESNFSAMRLLSLQRPKGDGQRARLYLALGAKTTNVSLQHTEPALFDSSFSLTNEGFFTTRYEDEYDERHIGYAATLGWPVAFELPFLSSPEYWNINTGLRIEQIRISDLDDDEEFDVDDGTDPADWKYPQGLNYSLKEDEGSHFANRLSIGLRRDTRNHFIFPDRGSRFTLDTELVTRALGSYADYMKFHAGIEKFLPVYSELFLRLSLHGYALKSIAGDDPKIFDRYFAGGFGTIRGFKRHDVSPVNRNETSVGGQTMVVGTAELIQPVANFMFLKLFTDWGNVWWDSFEARLNEFNGTIGVGVQLRQIPIRLDYGVPVRTYGDHLDGKSGRLHFSIDYSF